MPILWSISEATNQMFAMTSFGEKVDNSVNMGRGPYIFKVSGQIYHLIRSLCPKEGDHPWFLQLYIHDTPSGARDRCGRLFQKYVVTAFCAVEQSRLDFIHKRQNDLRSDYLLGLYDAISQGDREGIQAGSMFLYTILYTIEFQKRGLLHCHTLLWVDSSSKIQDAYQIDDYISAELPDPVEDPKGYKVVSKLMMHGPCGVANPSASCTEKGISFRAHINVEYCGWSMLIKYLFKYISKGPDRILRKIEKSVEDASTSTSERHIQVDEINYLDGHFICPFEACWRNFEYPIHRREPAVQILNVHFENMQRVNFCERDRLDVIVNMSDKKKTTLTEWYAYNNEYTDGRHLTYLDFHSEFKGCKSPIEVRTVNGQILPTYRAACEALGLLGDDREWDIALEESAVSASSAQLRTLFAQILIYCDVSDPPKLWRKHWEAMQDDIPAKISETTGILNYHVNTPELQDHILYELETILNGFGKSVKEFGLPSPSERLLKDLKNKLLMEEKNYNCDTLMQETALFVPKLNQDQKEIYNLIINASEESRQELLFVYGHGGTGKTFLWKTIISSLRSQGKIVLAVASSGIASLILPAGRTAHSRFKLPLELTDESVCHAKKHSQLGNLLVETNLIIWDEAPMNDKRCFEALDKTLRDLMNAPETLFGGKTIILGGDFQQTLPVKKGAAKQELTMNGNWHTQTEYEASQAEADKDNNEDTFWITVPQQYCINPNAVNATILSSIEGVTKTYLSRDEAIPMGRETSETDMLYPMEYLNTITFPGFPPHELQLKVGSPIMLLRNVNLSGGLCNGTRMIVISLMSRSFIPMSVTAIASLKVGQEDCIIEAKVYRKWISKSIPDMKEQAFCCILIDRENTAVQANVDLKNLNQFDQMLKLKTAYRISNFICENTKPYQQTLGNKISLKFGKITSFQVLPGKESEFPEHHFEFISYNQLSSRVPYRDEQDSKMIYPILTDVQLSATPATYYYINPKNQEAENAYKMFEDKYSLNPPLQVTKYRYDDPEQEKTRNRQTLYALLQQNRNTSRGVRFTCEAMITSLNNKRSWSYASCSQCSKASTKRNGVNTCEDHGEQEPPTYRYNFKVTVADGTATAEFTFFTAAGQKITGHPCSYLKQKYEATDTSQLPVEMVNTIGEKHIFQIEFDPSTQKGAGRFIVNDILDINPPAEKRNTGQIINESTSKNKSVTTELATTTAPTTIDSTNEDTSVPGMYYPLHSKAPGFNIYTFI
ncbi:DNA helicase [Tanacetum coccineum]